MTFLKAKGCLAVAEQSALAAGAYLRHLPPDRRFVDSAVGKDIKLRADREAEAIIIKSLTAVADYPLLSEECGVSGQIDSEEPCWVIDPLDGTMNYARGLELACVSIALWQSNAPLIGVVYDFNHDELFSGLVGVGAWRNGQAIAVSGIHQRAQAVLATGFPVGRDYADDALRLFISQVQAFKKVRMLGTAALSLAYVACGRVDAYWEEGIKLWDVGAGLALVRAAGGWITCTPAASGGFARDVRAAADARLFLDTPT